MAVFMLNSSEITAIKIVLYFPYRFTFKHADNQAIVARIIREVQRENHTFIAADIRSKSAHGTKLLAKTFFNLTFLHVGSIYTYYKSLCQEESLKRRGKLNARKKQWRQRERITRVCFLPIQLHSVFPLKEGITLYRPLLTETLLYTLPFINLGVYAQ